jgi:2-polyprenyl-3-methyl-5-hydroxy-6-metoxy-1,4-benzoquinol methylase
MNYFYSHVVLPGDKCLLQGIEAAAERINEKLRRLTLSELGISEYNQSYLGNYIRDIQGTLQINCYILAWALASSQVPLEKFVFVDYGGGCGIMSLLAKELGVGTVIYNDIYDVSCRDARLIARALQSEAHAYVCGDIDELISYLRHQDVFIDAIASYDVIEHIYDIEGFFRKLRFLPSNALRVVFASSANNRNPVIKRQRIKTHLAVEYSDREKMWGHKERDSLQSYLALRKEIIASYDPSLSPDIIEQLASSTRGLMKNEIERFVMEYQNAGNISYKPRHPTNTCDPYTGNWAEHLMDIPWIENIFLSEGFSVAIKSGYYGFSAKLYIRMIKNLLNCVISVLQAKGLLFAPFYMVCAQRGCFENAKASEPSTTNEVCITRIH